jgi:hypothetical protein
VTAERMFPVLFGYDRKNKAALLAAGCPESVPWRLLAPHEQRAWRNHSQTLERLASRGGLAVNEMVWIIEDRGWGNTGEPDELMLPRLLVALAKLTETP